MSRISRMARAGWFTAVLALAFAGYADVAANTRPVRVVMSFVVIGCNRVMLSDVSGDNPSTANLAQLERSFDEIAKLRPHPNLVFFTGDMVMGLNLDLNVLRNQLESWVDEYRSMHLDRTRKSGWSRCRGITNRYTEKREAKLPIPAQRRSGCPRCTHTLPAATVPVSAALTIS
jgi:hypothetical protein